MNIVLVKQIELRYSDRFFKYSQYHACLLITCILLARSDRSQLAKFLFYEKWPLPLRASNKGLAQRWIGKNEPAAGSVRVQHLTKSSKEYKYRLSEQFKGIKLNCYVEIQSSASFRLFLRHFGIHEIRRYFWLPDVQFQSRLSLAVCKLSLPSVFQDCF